LSNGLNRSGAFLWLGPAWGHDFVEIQPGGAQGCCGDSISFAREWVQRDRLVFDGGVLVSLAGTPLYGLAGLGCQGAVGGNADRLQNKTLTFAETLFQDISPNHLLRVGTSGRILVAVGAGW
jgi:hypothetical protein